MREKEGEKEEKVVEELIRRVLVSQLRLDFAEVERVANLLNAPVDNARGPPIPRPHHFMQFDPPVAPVNSLERQSQTSVLI